MGEASLLWNQEGMEWECRSAQEALQRPAEGESTRETAKQ